MCRGEVDTIVRRHPSRVLLLVGEADSPGGRPSRRRSRRTATSAANATRSARRGHRQRRGRRGPQASLDRALAPGRRPADLALVGLPPSPPPLGGAVFDELLPMADQVIYSSLRWPDPVPGTLATADWVRRPSDRPPASPTSPGGGSSPGGVDRSVARPGRLPGAIDGIDRVEVEHGPHGLPQAWLLAGWLASSLGWRRRNANLGQGPRDAWTFRGTARAGRGPDPPDAEGASRSVSNVRVGWSHGESRVAVTFAATGAGRLSATSPAWATCPVR